MQNNLYIYIIVQKEKLFGKKLSEIKEIVAELGLPKFAATQITDWLYKKDITTIAEMTNLSARNREILSEKYEFGVSLPVKEEVSMDGTKKYLYKITETRFVESAYMPEEKRDTLCVSTQVGCKMKCVFCMTGKQGFQQNLSAGEIVNQVRSLPERESISNVVYMGMGEPMDNLEAVMDSLEIFTADWGFAMSPKRFTVSTIGLTPAMKHFLDFSKCNLAVSLHTPFDSERLQLMPIQKVHQISDVVHTIKQYDWAGQRRVFFEYIMFKDLNDTPEHARELIKLLSRLSCRVNLIRFHKVPGVELEGTSDKDMIAFRDTLTAGGVFSTIRQSRGQDIAAACGMLSTKEANKA